MERETTTSPTQDVLLRRTLAGRFRVDEVLKSAGGSTTARAVDVETGQALVVKLAPAAGSADGSEMLLDHLAAVLDAADSPHVAPIVAHGVDDEDRFVATPLVDGVTLDRRLANGPLSVTDALTLAEGLLGALDSVAGRGVVHGSVKPSNVVVDERAPLRSVTLVDFGLTGTRLVDPSIREVPLETAVYTSPEAAGLIHREVGHRSDLYSVGVVVYEALAGRPPFIADSARDVLRQHVTAAVPSLREAGVHVPRALDDLVRHLLSKEPKDRYQTARAALTDVREIREAVRQGVDDPAVVIGAHDRRCCVLGEPAFVGRREELSLLDEALARAGDGRSLLVAIEAESGGGKTRLLDEFARRCAERGSWVLRGQGLDQAAQKPFQTLRGVAEQVVARASADAGSAERLRERLGTHAGAARAAIPSLSEVLGSEEEEALGPEAYGADRSLAALSALFDALGSPGEPAVVVLDDCQWADPPTIRLLRRWRNQSTRGSHVLVVVAYRTEEVTADDALRETPEDDHLALPRLGSTEIGNLVESMAGRLDVTAVEAVVELAQGSPFMASAVLHGLTESGALVCGHPGWTVNRDALADVRSSDQAATFLAQRLELLPTPTLAMLTAGAVLGKEFDLETAANLAAQSATEAIAARDAARERHLVWSAGAGASLAFVHDKIREALLARLDEVDRRRLHAAAAARIEVLDDTRSFELAYHFGAAGQHERALPYALAAAAQARAQHSLEIAEQQYRIAERAIDGADRATCFTIARGLGDVAMLLGRYEQAHGHYERSLDLADGRSARSAVEARLAELAFKKGDLDASAAASERGLRLLGRRVPRSALGFAVAALWQICVQAAHTVAPRLFVGRRPVSERAEDDLLAARHYSRLAHVYWFTRGPIPTLWTHLREMNLAERYQPTRELAQAYSEHAPVMTLLPWYDRGIRYARRSHEIRRELNDVWGQGQSLNFYGIVLFGAGRMDETVDTCREAIRLLERTGDRWELNIAKAHLAYAWYRQGKLAEAVELSRALHREGIEIGDVQATGIAAEIWSLASGGKVPEEVVSGELERDTPDVQVAVQVMLGEAVRLIADERHEDAAEVLVEAVRRARRARVRNEYVAPARIWLATALREWAESLPAYSPERRQVLRRATKAARRARRIARVYRNSEPQALREAGAIAAVSGRPRAARRLLVKAIASASARGARHEEALALRELGRFGDVFGWPDSASALADGTRRAGEIESAVGRVLESVATLGSTDVTLSLVDRFGSLLDHGRRLASGLSRDAVFSAVETAALDLLRAEHCTVFDVTDGEMSDIAEVRGLPPELVESAARAGRPTVLATGSETPTPGSAICTPIFERGQVTACFYAEHRGVADLFGDDEQRLAAFVGTVAGAALENARGFEEVQALQRSLEDRVEARTSQLTTTLRELERVNSELKEASEAKSDFVSMVSHELRTPLTPIVGLSSTMLGRWKEMEEDVVAECLEAIHRQGTRLTRIVDDLLEISRIEAGNVEADPRRIDVADVIRTTLASMDLEPVEVRCPARLSAMADPDRLAQILINYLENARKYGAPPYRLGARISGPWVEIRVSDAGPGVPAGFEDELFTRFSRAPEARDESGTGLGLSIVQGLARAQGGEAFYEAGNRTGACFGVRLPRPGAAAHARVDADVTGTTTAPGDGPSSRSSV